VHTRDHGEDVWKDLFPPHILRNAPRWNRGTPLSNSFCGIVAAFQCPSQAIKSLCIKTAASLISAGRFSFRFQTGSRLWNRTVPIESEGFRSRGEATRHTPTTHNQELPEPQNPKIRGIALSHGTLTNRLKRNKQVTATEVCQSRRSGSEAVSQRTVRVGGREDDLFLAASAPGVRQIESCRT
jgi:hypothetical protein